MLKNHNKTNLFYWHNFLYVHLIPLLLTIISLEIIRFIQLSDSFFFLIANITLIINVILIIWTVKVGLPIKIKVTRGNESVIDYSSIQIKSIDEFDLIHKKILDFTKKWHDLKSRKFELIFNLFYVSIITILLFESNYYNQITNKVLFASWLIIMVIFAFSHIGRIFGIISEINILININEESLTPYQTKEENLYEELRTRFAFHNITKDVRNLKSYITILKHEEPQLSSKFNTLDELTDMIEDTLSKFKNSDTIRTKNPFQVHELFDNFLILNKPDLVREGSDLQIEYKKTEYKNVEIHQTFYEVYQVLNNLIDNARKAIANADRKEIQIMTSVSKEGFVDFQVSDTGVGIDVKARNRVFDIGYSTTNGDGLGLLFVQTTLKRFGGEIQLLPTAISGFSTTFEVRIPAQKG